jgi:hypothetical protein
VSVDLSSTSDAYLVKEFDRKALTWKQMNQFHNHGIKGHFAKFAVKDGKLFEFACKVGDLGRWIAAGYGTVVGSDISGQLGQSERDLLADDHRRQSTHGILPDGRRHTDAPASGRDHRRHAHQ